MQGLEKETGTGKISDIDNMEMSGEEGIRGWGGDERSACVRKRGNEDQTGREGRTFAMRPGRRVERKNKRESERRKR